MYTLQQKKTKLRMFFYKTHLNHHDNQPLVLLSGSQNSLKASSLLLLGYKYTSWVRSFMFPGSDLLCLKELMLSGSKFITEYLPETSSRLGGFCKFFWFVVKFFALLLNYKFIAKYKLRLFDKLFETIF